MKKIIAVIMVLTLSAFLEGDSVSSEAQKRKQITPYGAFCSRTSHYGIHQAILDNKQVEKALKHYYNVKGLDIEIVDLNGRFIKALVKDKDAVVDKVIFDRRSGRIRSVYQEVSGSSMITSVPFRSWLSICILPL